MLPSEIPEDLYQVISEAASLRMSLKTNKNDKDSKNMLCDKEETINLLAMYYKAFHVLPSSWEYNHETALSLNLPKPPKPPKKKKIKRIPGSPPNIKRIPLNEEEHKVWMKFKTIDEAIEANECVSFPMEKRLVAVKDTDPLVDLIGEFAVDAFNKSYQTLLYSFHLLLVYE
ncbi:40S ribosomal protein S13, partial [Tanacetum coccineum]